MEILNLTLETLAEFDPRLAVAANGLIMHASRDIQDRLGDDTWREVHITIKMRPERDMNNKLTGARVQGFAKGKIPDKRTEEVHMSVGSNGLTFNPDNLEDEHPTLNYGRNDDR